MRKALTTLLCASSIMGALSAAETDLKLGDVIALDLGRSSGSATNYNVLGATEFSGGTSGTIASGNVKKYNSPSETAKGVSITVSGFEAFDSGTITDWSGTATDPYHTDEAEDYGRIAAGKTGQIKFSGLDSSLQYNVRVYSLMNYRIGEDGNTVYPVQKVKVGDGTRFHENMEYNSVNFIKKSLPHTGLVFPGMNTNVSGDITIEVSQNIDWSTVSSVVIEAVTNNARGGKAFIGCARGLEMIDYARQGLENTIYLNDGDRTRVIDTKNRADEALTSAYVGVKWDIPQTKVNGLRLTLDIQSDGGWFGQASSDDPAQSNFRSAYVEVSGDGVSWVNVKSSTVVGGERYTASNQTRVMSSAKAGMGQADLLFSFNKPVDNIKAIRIYGSTGGTGSVSPGKGFIAVSEIEAYSTTEVIDRTNKDIAPGDVIALDLGVDDVTFIPKFNVLTLPNGTPTEPGSLINYNNPIECIKNVFVKADCYGKTTSRKIHVEGSWKGATNDAYYSLGLNNYICSVRKQPYNVTIGGLDKSLKYNLRVYSFGLIKDAYDYYHPMKVTVTDGDSFKINEKTMHERLLSTSLEDAGLVFSNLTANGRGNINIRIDPDDSEYAKINGLVLEAVSPTTTNVSVGGTTFIGLHDGSDFVSYGQDFTGNGSSNTTVLNDGQTSNVAHTKGGDANSTFGFVGVRWTIPQRQINKVTLNLDVQSDGGWFGNKDNDNPADDAGTLTSDPLKVQVTYDGKSWRTVDHSNNYNVAAMTAGQGGTLVNFTLAKAADEIKGIRIIGPKGGTGGSSSGNGFLAVREIITYSAQKLRTAVSSKLNAGDVIALDFGSVTGAAANYNVIDSLGTTTLSSGTLVKYNKPDEIAEGVSVSLKNADTYLYTDDAEWPYVENDPYYTDQAKDFVVPRTTDTPLELKFSGLDKSLAYDVRVYELHDIFTSPIKVIGDKTETIFLGHDDKLGSSKRFLSKTLEEAKLVYDEFRPDANGDITVRFPNPPGIGHYAQLLNAVVLEVTNPLYNRAPKGTAIMGRKSTDYWDPKEDEITSNYLAKINDGAFDSAIDTKNGNDQSFSHSYVGIKWENSQSGVMGARLVLDAQSDGGWFGSKSDNNPQNDKDTVEDRYDGIKVEVLRRRRGWRSLGPYVTHDYDVASFTAGSGDVVVNFRFNSVQDDIIGLRVVGPEGGYQRYNSRKRFYRSQRVGSFGDLTRN